MSTELGFHAVNKKVVIKPPANEETIVSKGGIHLLERSVKETFEGTVVSIGTDVLEKAAASNVKVGSVVRYSPYGAYEVKVHGRPYKIVDFDDIHICLHDLDAEEEVA